MWSRNSFHPALQPFCLLCISPGISGFSLQRGAGLRRANIWSLALTMKPYLRGSLDVVPKSLTNSVKQNTKAKQVASLYAQLQQDFTTLKNNCKKMATDNTKNQKEEKGESCCSLLLLLQHDLRLKKKNCWGRNMFNSPLIILHNGTCETKENRLTRTVWLT